MREEVIESFNVNAIIFNIIIIIDEVHLSSNQSIMLKPNTHEMKLLISVCMNNTSNSLFAHFLYINFISYYILTFISIIMFLKNPFKRWRYPNVHPVIVIRTEYVNLCVYMLFSFFYHWLYLMRNYKNILSVFVIRWFIEANSFLFILLAYNITAFQDWMIKKDPDARMSTITMLKICLFFIMRYAEGEPEAFMNKVQMGFFAILCYRSDYYSIYINYLSDYFP